MVLLGSKKELSIAKCSGYHAYLKTSYDKEEHLADPKSFISSLTIPFYEEHDYFFVYVEYQNFTGIHQEEIILHVFILFQENSLLLSETNTIIQSYWDKVYSRSSFNQIWILRYWISWIILIIVLI